MGLTQSILWNQNTQKIILTLSKNESLILLEWLSKFNEFEHPSLFEDQAEERFLFDLKCILESVISETFDADYENKLNQARNEIRDKI